MSLLLCSRLPRGPAQGITVSGVTYSLDNTGKYQPLGNVSIQAYRNMAPILPNPITSDPNKGTFTFKVKEGDPFDVCFHGSKKVPALKSLAGAPGVKNEIHVVLLTDSQYADAAISKRLPLKQKLHCILMQLPDDQVTRRIRLDFQMENPTDVQPLPELQYLAQLVGKWDVTFRAGEGEGKGKTTYTMDMKHWLAGESVYEVAGQRVQGRSFQTYDPHKQKYVEVWIDSSSNTPLVLDGTYDGAKKVLTMSGTGPGPDARPVRYRIVRQFRGVETFVDTIFMTGPNDRELQVMEITYRRSE